jgi:hypothetical protein
MKELTLFRHFPEALTVGYLPGAFLVKETSALYLFPEEDTKPARKVLDPLYAKKTVISPDGKYAVLVSSLFNEETTLYHLPDFADVFHLSSRRYGKKLLFKDAAFLSDSKALYLLADTPVDGESETLLFKVSLPSYSYSVFFSGQHRKIDFLRYSRDLASLALFSKSGQVTFFRETKAVKSIKTPPFEKLFFIEKGELMLLDTLSGFKLLSHNGKLIRNADFLVSEPLSFDSHDEDHPLKTPRRLTQSYADLTYSREHGRLFYLSHLLPSDSYHLYVFSIEDFSLLEDFPLKGKVLSLSYNEPYLFVRKEDGVDSYLLRHRNPEAE